MNRRAISSAVILLVAIALGAFRDFLFVNLNYQLDHLLHQRADNYAHSVFRAWADGLDAAALRNMKWALAVAFVAANALLAMLLARVRFGDHRYRIPLLIGFAGVALLALMLHPLGRTWPPAGTVSIKLLHAVQYPIPLLMIWAASWIKPR